MDIKTSRRAPVQRAKAANNSSEVQNQNGQEPQEPKDKFKDMVVKGAYASGGALAGVGLGVATGGLLSSLTGATSLTTVGGVLGAVGGAGTAVAVIDSEDKGKTLRQVGLGWTLASVGSGAGQFIAGPLLQQLATAAGSGAIATAAPFIGTAVGAVVGAAIPMNGEKGTVPEALQRGAVTSGLASLGLIVGTAGKAWAMMDPRVAHMGTIAPFLGAAAGGLGGFSISRNVVSGIESENLEKAATSLGGSAFYYGIGSVAGAFAHLAGGSSAYTYAFPAMGAAAGALLGFGATGYGDEKTQSEQLANHGGIALLGAGAGTMAGDVLGNILTAATGQSIYANTGFALGAAQGGLMALAANGLDTKKAVPISLLTTIGTTIGTTVGALGGAGLTALTGNNLYNQIGGVVGGINGGLGSMEAMEIDTKGAFEVGMFGSAGLAVGELAGTALTAVTGHNLYANTSGIAGLANGVVLGLDKSGLVDTKGAAETLSGAMGGVGVGALLGASLDALTGNEIWGIALPVLGAAAGGLGVLATVMSKEDGKGEE